MASLKSGLAIAITLIVALVLIVVATNYSTTQTTTAPDFSITNIDGLNIKLTALRGNVVVLDFMYIACTGCKPITQNLMELYPALDPAVRVISIDIYPTDTVSMLIKYRDNHTDPGGNVVPIPWWIAPDTDSLQTKYGASAVPQVVVVDKKGAITWVWKSSPAYNPSVQKSEMSSAITNAVSGVAVPTSVASASVLALAVLAAVGSFFSPCSFPLLPGYMMYYLGIDAETKQKPSNLKSAGRGFLAAIGIICVYGIIAAVVLAAGYSAAAALPYLGPIVGGILIFLGVLTLTPLQYHKIIEPFRKLRQRIFPSKADEPGKQRVGVKMFAYGVGYGAAGFACVAPPFIAAILNATIYGNVFYGVLVLLVYASIVIVLMIAITVLLSVAGQAAVAKMNRYTNAIKKISGIALIIAGAYLIYFWYVTR